MHTSPFSDRTAALLATFIVLATTIASATARPEKSVVPIYSKSGMAIQGFDPVAYFAEGRAVEGREEHTFEWQGATWRFASAENRQRFVDAPADYAPQYGGYCSYAVSEGYTAKSDPQAFAVIDGKLYLNYDHSIQKRWQRNAAERIERADQNWPQLHE
jgi:YHS domain-containing protein